MRGTTGIGSGITNGMKTAISVEDSLLEQADEVARELGLSRSGMISEALRAYLKQRRQSRTTELLNQAYDADPPTEEEMRLVHKFKTKLTVKDRW